MLIITSLIKRNDQKGGKHMAGKSKPIENEKKPANAANEGVQFERVNSKQCDGLYEYLYRRYAEGKSLFSVEETAIYAAGVKNLNESDSRPTY